MVRVSGDISEKLYFKKDVTWKIPNVFDLIRSNSWTESSPFVFANGTWCFRMFTTGPHDYRSFDLMLARLHSVIPMQEVSFSISLKARHGKDYEFAENTHNFTAYNSSRELRYFLEEEELHDRRATLAPNNTLTICCRLRTRNNDGVLPPPATNGQLSDESLTKKKIVWKIPNIFDLPNSPDHCVRTPTFTFLNATWSLQMYTSGPEAQNLELGIVRLNSGFPEHIILMDVYVKTAKGANLFNLKKCMDFHDNENEENKQFPFLEWAQLRSRRSRIAPSDILTIVCHIGTQVHEVAQNQAPIREYSDKVLQDLREMLQDEVSTDVTLDVQGQQFRAHKSILIARSPVLASVVRGHEHVEGIVEIDDCDPSTFPDFLRFLYYGDIRILTVENVLSLYTTGDYFQVQDLRSMCAEFMKSNMTSDIFCDIIGLFLQSPEMDLTELTTDFFANNWKEVIRTGKWNTLFREYPLYCNELLNRVLSPRA